MFSISKWGDIITRRSAAKIKVKLFWLAEVQKFVQPKFRVPHLTLALIIVATTFVGDILVRANKKNPVSGAQVHISKVTCWMLEATICRRLLAEISMFLLPKQTADTIPSFCWCDSICSDMLWFKCHWFASQIQIWFLQSSEFQVRLVFSRRILLLWEISGVQLPSGHGYSKTTKSIANFNS
jgi:hypothetical protein